MGFRTNTQIKVNFWLEKVGRMHQPLTRRLLQTALSSLYLDGQNKYSTSHHHQIVSNQVVVNMSCKCCLLMMRMIFAMIVMETSIFLSMCRLMAHNFTSTVTKQTTCISSPNKPCRNRDSFISRRTQILNLRSVFSYFNFQVEDPSNQVQTSGSEKMNQIVFLR